MGSRYSRKSNQFCTTYHSNQFFEPIYRADTLQAYLKDLESLSYVAPIIRGQVILQYKEQITGAILKGVPNVLDIPQLAPILILLTQHLQQRSLYQIVWF